MCMNKLHCHWRHSTPSIALLKHESMSISIYTIMFHIQRTTCHDDCMYHIEFQWNDVMKPFSWQLHDISCLHCKMTFRVTYIGMQEPVLIEHAHHFYWLYPLGWSFDIVQMTFISGTTHAWWCFQPSVLAGRNPVHEMIVGTKPSSMWNVPHELFHTLDHSKCLTVWWTTGSPLTMKGTSASWYTFC